MYFIEAEYDTLPPICKSIFDGNIDQAISLITLGEHFHAADENGNSPIHYSVMCDSESLLDCLLLQHHINVDIKNQDGETAFLMSLKMRRSPSFIRRFINASCDVNTQNEVQEIALHLAVSYCLNDTVLDMLERGADVDIRDTCNQTALHAAVECKNLEGGCMLLCFGADVTITEHANMTAFMFALNDFYDQIAELLFYYQCDFSDVSIFGDTPLLIATRTKSSLAVNIVKAGANANCLTRDGISPLQYSLQYEDAELFKLLWLTIDPNELTNTSKPLLLIFISNCSFSNKQWLECMYLILESPNICDLITHIRKSMNGSLFLSCMLKFLCKRNIESKDITAIIYALLSFGITENMSTFSHAFNYYLQS